MVNLSDGIARQSDLARGHWRELQAIQRTLMEMESRFGKRAINGLRKILYADWGP